MDIKHIVLIINILSCAKKIVDLFIYSEQAHSLAVCSTLRSFFFCSLNHRIKLWNCPSNTKWSLHQLVYDNLTNIRVVTRFYLVTSINSFCSKSVLSCLDAQRILFNCSTVQKCYFLTLRDKYCKLTQPSYFKSGIWLSYIGQVVILYTRCKKTSSYMKFQYANITDTHIKPYRVFIFYQLVILNTVELYYQDCKKWTQFSLLSFSFLFSFPIYFPIFYFQNLGQEIIT